MGRKKKILYRAVTSETAPCVIAAIEAKDKTLTGHNAEIVAELNNAIAARTTCQKTALAIIETQKKALAECVKIFKDAQKQIKEKAKKTHQAIFKTYRDSLKVCSKTASGGNTASSTAKNDTASQEFNIDDGGGNIIDISESKD